MLKQLTGENNNKTVTDFTPPIDGTGQKTARGNTRTVLDIRYALVNGRITGNNFIY